MPRKFTSMIVVCCCLAVLEASAQDAAGSARALLPFGQLDLTDAQRANLNRIRRDLHQRHCELTGRIIDTQENVRELLAEKRTEPMKLARTLRELDELQRQLTDARDVARKRAESLLTVEQKQALHEWRTAQPRPPTQQPELLWEYMEPQLYPYPPRDQPPSRWIRPPPALESG